jgi:hypothetical protein
LLLLYSNDNPPPSVRIIVLLLTFFLAINTFNWLVTQELYLDREIDVALSDEDNVGLNEPIGDDAEGNGVPSAETLAPNPIRSHRSIRQQSKEKTCGAIILLLYLLGHQL